jgi:hypothetical protein
MKYTLLFIFYQIQFMKMLSNSSAAEAAADWSAMILRHYRGRGSHLLVIYIIMRMIHLTREQFFTSLR